MSLAVVVWLGLFLVLIDKGIASSTRQKRCIVIQKQSGSRGDSAETDNDNDYRRPQPKEPAASDRLRRTGYGDTENITSELLKYKTLPIKTRDYQLRKRLFRKYL